MRRLLPILLLSLAACGGGSSTLEGTLADSTEATEVWALGRPERIPIVDGAFRVEKVEGDTVELRFTTGDDAQARMVLQGLRGGAVRIDGVWFDEEVAFPARVSGADRPLVVNGLRMAGPEAVPENVNLPATVLAVSDDGDALVIRPDDASLPDLNVLVTPASVVRTIDGDLVEPDQLAFGDSLRISGIGEGGHVIAAEIMVSRRVAANDADDREASRPPAREEGGALAESAPRPVARPAALVRESPPGHAEPRGKGNGKGGGNGGGKGKGRN